jgi:hypothetical protein
MVFLSVPVAKQPPGWAENRREFARRKKTLLQKRRFWGILVIAISHEKIPVSADMQPASQAGCLFVGFDNSVNSGGAERFGPAT